MIADLSKEQVASARENFSAAGLLWLPFRNSWLVVGAGLLAAVVVVVAKQHIIRYWTKDKSWLVVPSHNPWLVVAPIPQ